GLRRRRGTSATRCPFARRWSLYSQHSSNVACRSSSVIPSNFPGSMYPKQMYFIVLLPLVGASGTAVADFSVTVSSNEAQPIPIQESSCQPVLLVISPAG